MIRFKHGLEIHPDSIRFPEVMRIIDAVCAEAVPGYDVTVTSGCDGEHSMGSSHYIGKAFDIRIRDYPGKIKTWTDRIRQALGKRYFVLLEADHIHIQWNG